MGSPFRRRVRSDIQNNSVGHIRRQANLTRFGYGHPFWEEFVRRAQEQEPLGLILRHAYTVGYTDLTLFDLQVAVRTAPHDLNLPDPRARMLRRAFESLSSSFNSFEATRDLTQEAIRQYSAIDEELQQYDYDNATLSERARITALQVERRMWFDKAFNSAKSCVELEIKIVNPNRQPDEGVVSVQEEDKQQYLRQLEEEFKQIMPPTPDNVLIKEYGGQNIRPPILEAESHIITPSNDDNEFEDE